MARGNGKGDSLEDIPNPLGDYESYQRECCKQTYNHYYVDDLELFGYYNYGDG